MECLPPHGVEASKRGVWGGSGERFSGLPVPFPRGWHGCGRSTPPARGAARRVCRSHPREHVPLERRASPPSLPPRPALRGRSWVPQDLLEGGGFPRKEDRQGLLSPCRRLWEDTKGRRAAEPQAGRLPGLRAGPLQGLSEQCGAERAAPWGGRASYKFLVTRWVL